MPKKIRGSNLVLCTECGTEYDAYRSTGGCPVCLEYNADGYFWSPVLGDWVKPNDPAVQAEQARQEREMEEDLRYYEMMESKHYWAEVDQGE